MKKLLIVVIIAVLAIVAWQFVSKNSRRSKAGGGPPVNVFLNQNRFLIPPNGGANLNVFFQTNPGEKVSAATITLYYDPAVLQYQPTAPGVVDTSCTNWKFTTDVAIQDDTTTGVLTVSRAILDVDANLPSGIFCFGTFPFVPRSDLQLTNGQVTSIVSFGDSTTWQIVGPNQGYFADPNPNGSAATIIVTNASITPSSGPGDIILHLNLKFQGIDGTGLSSSSPITMPVRVAIAGGSLPSPVAAPAPVNFLLGNGGVWGGTVTISGVLPGTGYKILIKGPKHIQKKICDATPTESQTGPLSYHCDQGTITLVAGDNTFNFTGITQPVGDLPSQDGVLDAYDLTYVRNNLGSTDSRALGIGDLNLDGIINTQDYSLILESVEVRPDEL